MERNWWTVMLIFSINNICSNSIILVLFDPFKSSKFDSFTALYVACTLLLFVSMDCQKCTAIDFRKFIRQPSVIEWAYIIFPSREQRLPFWQV